MHVNVCFRVSYPHGAYIVTLPMEENHLPKVSHLVGIVIEQVTCQVRVLSISGLVQTEYGPCILIAGKVDERRKTFRSFLLMQEEPSRRAISPLHRRTDGENRRGYAHLFSRFF